MRNRLNKLKILINVLFFNYNFIKILKNSIVLSTISKSGTQYARTLIGNYLINFKKKIIIL